MKQIELELTQIPETKAQFRLALMIIQLEIKAVTNMPNDAPIIVEKYGGYSDEGNLELMELPLPAV